MKRVVDHFDLPITRGGHFFRGFSQPARALSLLLRTPGLKRYAVFPLLVNTIVYIGIVVLAIYLLWGWNMQVPDWSGRLWGVGGYISTAANWLLATLKWVIAIPVIAIVCYFTFTAVGMIVASPFNDMLSEKVEQSLCYEKPLKEIPWELTIRSLGYGLFDAIRGSARQLLITLLVLPVLLVPIVGLVIFFLVEAYAAGRGFADVSMARNFLRPRHKHPFVSAHRLELLGLGVAMQLLFFIPFVGLFMLPIGIVAGTQLYCLGDWEKLIGDHGLDWPDGFQPPLLNCDDLPLASASANTPNASAAQPLPVEAAGNPVQSPSDA